MTRSTTAPLHLSALPAARPVLALWGGLAVLDVGQVVGAAPLVRTLALSVLVALCSYGAGRVVAVSVAAIGWLLLNGFVEHELGRLGFTGTEDVVRAAWLLLVALGAAELGR